MECPPAGTTSFHPDTLVDSNAMNNIPVAQPRRHGSAKISCLFITLLPPSMMDTRAHLRRARWW
jgi:hypothetical protein